MWEKVTALLWGAGTEQPCEENTAGHNMETRGRSYRQHHELQPTSNHKSNLLATIAGLEREVRRHQQRFQGLKNTLRQERHRMEDLEERNEALCEAYFNLDRFCSDMVKNVIKPYAQKAGIALDTRDYREADSTLKRLLHDAYHGLNMRSQPRASQTIPDVALTELGYLRQEVRSLQVSKGQNDLLKDQVQKLQEELLAKIDNTQALSDDYFAQEFRTLVSMVRTQSRMVHVKGSLDTCQILGIDAFLMGVPLHHWNGRARTRTFVEARMWTLLLEIFFGSPFILYKDLGAQVYMIWTELFGKNHQHQWPEPSKSAERWRRTTLESICRSPDSEDAAAAKHEDAVEALVRKQSLCIAELAKKYEEFFQLSFPGSKTSQIPVIFRKAHNLAVQMSLQRSRMQITYPEIGARFQEKEMSFVLDRDGENLEDEVVAFVVNPGLTKWGDAHGEKFEHRHDVVRALVQLEPIQILYTHGQEPACGAEHVYVKSEPE